MRTRTPGGPLDRPAAAVGEAAALLVGSASSLANEMSEAIVAQIPELTAGMDEQLLEETQASCQSNIVALMTMLGRGMPIEHVDPPLEAIEYARSMVRRGVEFPAVLRAYRVGHAFLWQTWADTLTERLEPAGELAATLRSSSAFMFAYVDSVCGRLAAEYGAERERWLRSAAAVRAETARALLDASEPLDAELASRRLGYELRRHHVAVVVWHDSPSGADGLALEEAAVTASTALGCREPLLVPVGRAVMWAWAGAHEPVPLSLLDHIGRARLADGVRLAAGGWAHGPAGFRESHEEAALAHRLLTRGGSRWGPVTRYDSVSLAALLCADGEHARRFVRRELGPLAERDDATARLRATLGVYLEEGNSPVRAGRRIGIHPNTVTYRVRRAEELLGRPAAKRRLELEAALLLVRALGQDCLRAERPSLDPG